MSTLVQDNWMLGARCAEHPDVDFYARPGREMRRALALCVSCPVRADCLTHAILNEETEGIWGGVTAVRRRRMRVTAVAAA